MLVRNRDDRARLGPVPVMETTVFMLLAVDIGIMRADVGYSSLSRPSNRTPTSSGHLAAPNGSCDGDWFYRQGSKSVGEATSRSCHYGD